MINYTDHQSALKNVYVSEFRALHTKLKTVERVAILTALLHYKRTL